MEVPDVCLSYDERLRHNRNIADGLRTLAAFIDTNAQDVLLNDPKQTIRVSLWYLDDEQALTYCTYMAATYGGTIINDGHTIGVTLDFGAVQLECFTVRAIAARAYNSTFDARNAIVQKERQRLEAQLSDTAGNIDNIDNIDNSDNTSA